MTKDDVLSATATRSGISRAGAASAADRTFGTTARPYYARRAQVGRAGLEMAAAEGERRLPHMPNQLSAVEQRIVRASIAHPGLGPKQISCELAREKWGAILVSANGVSYGSFCDGELMPAGRDET